MARTPKDPDGPTLRLVRQVLEEPCPPPEIAAALAELLPPRRVRELLAPVNDVRLAIAVAIAERALETTNVHRVARLVSELADALGCSMRVTAEIVVQHHRGVEAARTAALDLVAAIEKVSQRTVRERIKAHTCEAGWVSRLVLRRAG
jgi:hypothetical protein